MSSLAPYHVYDSENDLRSASLMTMHINTTPYTICVEVSQCPRYHTFVSISVAAVDEEDNGKLVYVTHRSRHVPSTATRSLTMVGSYMDPEDLDAQVSQRVLGTG